MSKSKLTLLILLGLIFTSSCIKNDEDKINCLTFDAELPLLFLRIIDSSGTNLITNGTVNQTNIDVKGNFPSSTFQFIKENEIDEFDNSIALAIADQSSFQYKIGVDGFDDIVLDFTTELVKIPCDITFFEPIKVSFNTKELELMLFSPKQFLVVIEI